MPQYTGTILYFAVIIAIFYFLIIRPQMTRQKEQTGLLASLGVEDRVVTIGGVYGTIKSLDDEALDLEIADGVVVKVAKAAVAKKLEV